MAYVYRHIRLDKNEPFYIGIGGDSKYKRANELARRSEFWKKIVSKTKYEIEILFDDVTIEFAKLKEIEFIKLHGRKDLNKGCLVNMTDGGDGLHGVVFTDQYRKKLSDAAKKRVISEPQKVLLRGYRLGVPLSPETRKKISDKSKGRKLSQEHIDILKLRTGSKNPAYGKRGALHSSFKGKVSAFKDGILIGIFDGVHDCARNLPVTATRVSAVLNGKRNHTKGYTFKR